MANGGKPLPGLLASSKPPKKLHVRLFAFMTAGSMLLFVFAGPKESVGESRRTPVPRKLLGSIVCLGERLAASENASLGLAVGLS